ncbi:TadE-like protein [Corynebacterium breve]|uniref:TadE-like protein n=1 Tax=Corynebacterium breve TaxID=3049799 RepID=A0ABY8VEK9_9CORY|nr:Rv3654c family TadE-like protein [Corynebacterium breve]WIM67948.1 TadE-like protein [Corynebacterium breve]
MNGTHLLYDDRGYATVTSAGIIAAVVTLLAAVAGVVQHQIGIHRAQLAADLSAVAAATALYEGFDACAVAADTAGLNNSQLLECAVVDSDVVVQVAAGSAHQTSRAGPL